MSRSEQILESLEVPENPIDIREAYFNSFKDNPAVIKDLMERNKGRIGQSIISVKDKEIDNSIVLEVDAYSITYAIKDSSGVSIFSLGSLFDKDKALELKLFNDQLKLFKKLI